MEPSSGYRTWAATAVVTGCPLTPGEVRALARLLPEPLRVRVTRAGDDLVVRAALEHLDARAAADRLRRDVPRLLAGFPGRVVAAAAVPPDPVRRWSAVRSGLRLSPRPAAG